MKMTSREEVNSMERDFYDAKAAKARAIAAGDNFYMDADGILRCVRCDGRITIQPEVVNDRGSHFRNPPFCPRCEKK